MNVQFRVQEMGLHPELQSAGPRPTLLGCPEPACWSSPALLLIAVLLAACGGAGGAADADPAKAVPAGTAIYLEGVVRPEGDQRDDLMDAARKVLRTDDPEAKLHELIDKGLKESDGPATSYDKDIAPWLGQKAAVWVAGVDRAKPGYVVLVAAKDTEKAQAAIDKGAKSEKAVKERSYKDVDYQVDGDGVAAGIVGDFVAIGTEPEFKRTVAREGRRLARRREALQERDGRPRRRPHRELLRRSEAVHRAGGQVRPAGGRPSSSRSARSSPSTSSSR